MKHLKHLRINESKNKMAPDGLPLKGFVYNGQNLTRIKNRRFFFNPINGEVVFTQYGPNLFLKTVYKELATLRVVEGLPTRSMRTTDYKFAGILSFKNSKEGFISFSPEIKDKDLISVKPLIKQFVEGGNLQSKSLIGYGSSYKTVEDLDFVYPDLFSESKSKEDMGDLKDYDEDWLKESKKLHESRRTPRGSFLLKPHHVLSLCKERIMIWSEKHKEILVGETLSKSGFEKCSVSQNYFLIVDAYEDASKKQKIKSDVEDFEQIVWVTFDSKYLEGTVVFNTVISLEQKKTLIVFFKELLSHGFNSHSVIKGMSTNRETTFLEEYPELFNGSGGLTKPVKKEDKSFKEEYYDEDWLSEARKFKEGLRK